ncbi:MAG: ABC transporter substrate binding protein [Sedimenticolaceae bacterium]|nr:ABC transporter substrate binding protein [Sedimenticolaceae bacterium]
MRAENLKAPLPILITLFFLLTLAHTASARSCLFLASYHKGYEWQDGIEEGVRSTLGNRCTIEAFYLDTKRNTDEDYAKATARKARQLIDSMRPDVVIAVDDNASRYVIEPFYRDSDIPFVFCGVNWSAEKYGFPYPNVTGMLEIISIDPLLKVIQTVLPEASSGIFIGGDVPSTRSNYERYKKSFLSRGIVVKDGMVKTFGEWKQKLSEAQETADFIILANKAGILDWDQEAAEAHVRQNTKRFTVGHHEFMVNLNMFSMTKIPREQGEWAAKVAIKILEGSKPSDIPIVANRRWNIYANTGLLKKAGIQLPPNILRKAVKVGD